MWRVTKATDGGEDKKEQAEAKAALAKDLYFQGACAEALKRKKKLFIPMLTTQ
jgi:hypothetical protein